MQLIHRFIYDLKLDLFSRKQKVSFIYFVKDPVTRFHWYLRLAEHTKGIRSLFFVHFFIKYLFLSHSRSLGFSIPMNTLEPGVYIPHWGTIVINSRSRVGSGSVINTGVVVGRHPDHKDLVPIIGKNVYIGPGAKIFGRVSIGNDSFVGANAVVTKSYPNKSKVYGKFL